MLSTVVRNEETGQLTVDGRPHQARIEEAQNRKGNNFVFEEVVVVMEDGSRMYCFFLQYRLDGLATHSPITAAQVCNALMTMEASRSTAPKSLQPVAQEVLWGV